MTAEYRTTVQRALLSCRTAALQGMCCGTRAPIASESVEKAREKLIDAS